MRIVPGFLLRKIGAEWVAVPTGAAARRLNGLISLNETAAFLFRALETETDRTALLDALCAEYESPRDKLEADLDIYLSQMRELNLLEEARPSPDGEAPPTTNDNTPIRNLEEEGDAE